jgi:hypothetical protein
MRESKTIFLLIGISASVMMLVGLYKPYVMLWWKDVQTRRMVIRLYGSIALAGFLIYSLLQCIEL